MNVAIRLAWTTLTVSAVAAMPRALGQIDNGEQINIDGNGLNIRNDAANEPSFAINPLDSRDMVVGWRQFNTINSNFRLAGFAHTSNRGATWTNGGVLPPPPGSGVPNQSDPVLAVNNAGRFFYNSLLFGDRSAQVVYRSDDLGVSWNTPSTIFNSSSDKNWYAIDNTGGMGGHNHYCAFQLPGRFVRSIDDGATWQTPISAGVGVFAYVSVGLDGEVYLAWHSDDVSFRKSVNARDPGQTPSFTQRMDLGFGACPFYLPVNPEGGAGQVYVEVDPSTTGRRGWLYVLASSIQGADSADVMFARSTDGGTNFTTPVRVNDDTPGNGQFNWMAAMSVAPSGRIDAAWYDTREDPLRRISRMYYTFSYDGGDTWAPNRPISEPFDTRIGWPQQNKIGDYYQTHSDNGATSLVYAATFNGEQDLYFKREHPMVLAVGPLRAGQNGMFEVTGARPNSPVGLAYSLTGPGETFVGSLNVTLELANPQQAGPPRRTDANGRAVFILPIPPGAGGADVWFEAAQFEGASNVVATTITN